ncbi:sigma factor, partial [Rhizobium johnstonii]|uniref:sigma factor n=1 Tax=Rhizobium johnstonii TaxID=3019933 RepID=UPI003F945B6F
MTDIAWIDLSLSSALPKALCALLRYFRNLDTAEEAFQEAFLRAIRTWPEKVPPRDPRAWIFARLRTASMTLLRPTKMSQAVGS